MTVEKPKPKQLLRPITTGAGSAMNQSQFQAITCNSLEAIGFGFDSHWLENWRESFKPITKLSNRNHVITFDSHLKTALTLLDCFDVVGVWPWVKMERQDLGSRKQFTKNSSQLRKEKAIPSSTKYKKKLGLA